MRKTKTFISCIDRGLSYLHYMRDCKCYFLMIIDCHDFELNYNYRLCSYCRAFFSQKAFSKYCLIFYDPQSCSVIDFLNKPSQNYSISYSYPYY